MKQRNREEGRFDTEFASTAWSVRGESHRIDGFTAQSAGSGIDYLFCPRNEGIAFRVHAYSRPDGAEAMIHVFGDQETSPCRDRPGWPRGGRGVHQSPLPTLSAPPNTDFYGGAGHGGEDSWESNGYLFRTPDSGEILAWYGEQFSADGWTETDRSQDEVIAWSRWRKGTESALFLAVRWPATDVYHLLARATRLPGSADVQAE